MKSGSFTISWGRNTSTGYTRVTGRQTAIVGYGRNAPEIEADAIFRARDRFAPGAELEVETTYQIQPIQGVDRMISEEEKTTRLPGDPEPRLYYATLRVFELK